MLTVAPLSSPVDFNDIKDVLKGISVALVCVTFLSNAAYMVSKVSRKKSGVFFTARHSIKISLAFGGIVCALFYHVISTMIIFDMEGHGLNCMTTYLANCYFYTFLPVLYCVGIILLAFDLILRFKHGIDQTTGKSKLYAITCAILPWAVAFAVACPLLLTDIQWHLKCANTQSNNHFQAAIICCTIVPAILVLILAVGIALTIRPKRHYSFQQGFDSPMYTISSNSDYNMNGISGSVKQLNGSGHAQVPITTSSDQKDYPSFSNTQEKTASREKCKLLFSMLFLAVIILPYGGVVMYITTEYERMFTTVLLYMVKYDSYVAHSACSNILCLYPIVLPLVWICTKY